MASGLGVIRKGHIRRSSLVMVMALRIQMSIAGSTLHSRQAKHIKPFSNTFRGVDEVDDMQNFQNADTWKKAHSLALRLYEETKSLPRDETFGITMLLRRSAIDIAMQIAEACRREDKGQAAIDYRMAAGHCGELEYLVLLTKDLALWPPALCGELMASAVEVRDMLSDSLRAL